MADRKSIAVLGATGAQGGGLVRAILADPTGGFAVRAITRDATTEKARALAQMGAEVVQANVDDEASLTRAFQDAYGAYCVTFFWDHYSPEKETAEARNMARAAKAAGLQHVIWSTLEDVRRCSAVRRQDAHAMAATKPHRRERRGEQVLHRCRRSHDLLVPVHWDNLIYFGAGPGRDPMAFLVFTLATEDAKWRALRQRYRPLRLRYLQGGKRGDGKTIGIAGEHLTGAEMAAALTRALGREIRYNAVTPAT
jgi:uncharacterized protein YbjT (DUF2867 family)